MHSSGKQHCISGKEKSTHRDFIWSEGFITINSTGKKWSRRYRIHIWDFTTKEDVFMKPLSEKSTCYCLGMLGSRWKREKKSNNRSYQPVWFFFFFFSVYLFGCTKSWDLCLVACSMQTLSCSICDLVPWPGIDPWPLPWEHEVLATEPPSRSPASSSFDWQLSVLNGKSWQMTWRALKRY